MKNSSFTHLSPAIPCAIVLLLLASGCKPAMPPSAPHELLGQVVEKSDRPVIDGEITSIPVEGKVTIVDFWSSYCQPCLDSMPHLERYWRAAKGEGVAMVGVCLDDDPVQIRDTLSEMAVSFPQVVDDGHLLSGRYRVTAIPAAFVFDRTGALRFVALPGDYDHVSIIEAARFLLAE